VPDQTPTSLAGWKNHKRSRFCQLESENMNMDTGMLNKVVDKHASPGKRLSGRQPWRKTTNGT